MTTRTRTRRPYQVSVRYHGSTGVYPYRAITFADRDRAFTRARDWLTEAIERGGSDPSRYDVVIFGPDADLATGRIIRHDGTEIDLLEASAENAARVRDHLLSVGWTMEDIERGEKAR